VLRFPIKNRKILATSVVSFLLIDISFRIASSPDLSSWTVLLSSCTYLHFYTSIIIIIIIIIIYYFYFYFYYYYYYCCLNLFFLEDFITLIQIVYTFISWGIISNLRIYIQYFLISWALDNRPISYTFYRYIYVLHHFRVLHV
jgi:hypothetical protein